MNRQNRILATFLVVCLFLLSSTAQATLYGDFKENSENGIYIDGTIQVVKGGFLQNILPEKYGEEECRGELGPIKKPHEHYDLEMQKIAHPDLDELHPKVFYTAWEGACSYSEDLVTLILIEEFTDGLEVFEKHQRPDTENSAKSKERLFLFGTPVKHSFGSKGDYMIQIDLDTGESFVVLRYDTVVLTIMAKTDEVDEVVDIIDEAMGGGSSIGRLFSRGSRDTSPEESDEDGGGLSGGVIIIVLFLLLLVVVVGLAGVVVVVYYMKKHGKKPKQEEKPKEEPETEAVEPPAEHEEKPEPTPPEAEEEKKAKYCIECGAELKANAKFCTKCGTKEPQ
ncbi:zinc ribbon domain-containing protein [Candidatus Altiarchaeota archaeon]